MAQRLEMERCRRSSSYFFNNWVWTYDPRNAANGLPTFLPFDLYPRQEEMLSFIERTLFKREDGLIEKSRDIGFTWLTAGFALHKWLFVEGFKTTFGSRKEEYVDRIGDPDSIFEKIRLILYRLPLWMRPKGLNSKEHDNHMRILNPANGNTIRGEAGDQMGRGGRSTLYVIDEAAFIERAERVDAATSANTDVRLWGSTVNGMGNLFARKRHQQMRPDQIFRFHWRDDPRRDDSWATKKKAQIEPHAWASEYDIDYSASIEGICIPARWVAAAQRISTLMSTAGLKSNLGIGGLDVGAGGKAKSVFVSRHGPIVGVPIPWGDPDTIETAHRGLDAAQEAGVSQLRFDSVGVGAGVASALTKIDKPGLQTVGVNVGLPPSDRDWPDGQTSKEKFANLKAEAWFLARERFKSTYEMVLYLEGEEGGRVCQPNEIIVLPNDDKEAAELASQLSLPKMTRDEKGKILIEKKADLAKRGVPSPDYAEALILTFADVELFDSSYSWAT